MNEQLNRQINEAKGGNKKGGNKLSNWCKACHRAYSKENYNKNADKKINAAKKWQKKNKDKVKNYVKKYNSEKSDILPLVGPSVISLNDSVNIEQTGSQETNPVVS